LFKTLNQSKASPACHDQCYIPYVFGNGVFYTINFFPTPPVKLKLELHIGERLLITKLCKLIIMINQSEIERNSHIKLPLQMHSCVVGISGPCLRVPLLH
jgi:hypothetical protein